MRLIHRPWNLIGDWCWLGGGGGYKDSLLKDEDIYDDNYFYFILAEENNAIDGYPLKYKDKVDEDYVIFTLEEFLERFPYKVGDEFCNPYDKITEMFWDEEDEIVYYKTEYSSIGRDLGTLTSVRDALCHRIRLCLDIKCRVISCSELIPDLLVRHRLEYYHPAHPAPLILAVRVIAEKRNDMIAP